MHDFSISPVTHHYKFSSFDDRNLLSYNSGQMSQVGITGLISRYQKAAFLLEALRENLSLCLF